METNLSRRGFLTGAAVTGALAAMGLAGCAPQVSAEGNAKAADTGAATSWRDKPEMPTEFIETVDADIVVVGAGNGGLVAATTAAQNGAKVVVLEKAGAIAAAREAIGALNSKLAPDHKVDVPTLLNHANMTQSGDANMLMYKTWAEKSGEMIEWMADTLGPKGMLFPFEWHAPDDEHAYYPAMCYNPCIGEYNPDGPNYNAYAHLSVLSDVFTQDLGGEIRFECPAQQLIVDEAGKVTGVVAETEGGFIQVNAAKGVIVCTGGYGANVKMAQEYNEYWKSEYLADNIGTTNRSSLKGDGITMGLAVGADVTGMGWPQMMPLGWVDNGNLSLGAGENVIFINAATGKRYVDESAERDVLSLGGFENGMSKELASELGLKNVAGIYVELSNPNTNNKHPGMAPAEGRCYIWTVDELAEKLHLDKQTIIDTITEYDNYVMGVSDTLEVEKLSYYDTIGDVEKDEEGHYKPETYKIDKIAVRFQAPSTHHTMGGLTVDTERHVLDKDGNPIAGLYAAGEVTGGLFGGNRLGGNAVTEIVSSGRIAANAVNADNQ